MIDVGIVEELLYVLIDTVRSEDRVQVKGKRVSKGS